jgi:hypothetical protein
MPFQFVSKERVTRRQGQDSGKSSSRLVSYSEKGQGNNFLETFLETFKDILYAIPIGKSTKP